MNDKQAGNPRRILSAAAIRAGGAPLLVEVPELCDAVTGEAVWVYVLSPKAITIFSARGETQEQQREATKRMITECIVDADGAQIFADPEDVDQLRLGMINALSNAIMQTIRGPGKAATTPAADPETATESTPSSTGGDSPIA